MYLRRRKRITLPFLKKGGRESWSVGVIGAKKVATIRMTFFFALQTYFIVEEFCIFIVQCGMGFTKHSLGDITMLETMQIEGRVECYLEEDAVLLFLYSVE